MQNIKLRVKSFGMGQKGFTLIELLFVVAILGVLAAVAVPSVAKFIREGDEESREIELRDVQTAVVATLSAAGVNTLDGAANYDDVKDMTTITATDANSNIFTVAQFMVGLEDTNHDGTPDSTKIGYYDITLSGEVTLGTAQ